MSYNQPDPTAGSVKEWVDMKFDPEVRHTFYPFMLSPWHNCSGWLGIKHQVTYLLTYYFTAAGLFSGMSYMYVELKKT